MESLLLQLARTARRERAVASRRLESGLQLLVYPLGDGIMVGVGLERERSTLVKAGEVLQRRSHNLARFGAWLPAMFGDGSFHVFKRMPQAELDGTDAALPDEEWMAAEELLA